MNPVFEEMLQKFPVMRKLHDSPTLSEYLAPVMSWTARKEIFPYCDKLIALISAATEKLYGADAAHALTLQLENECFIAETGPHAHLPRDLDRSTNGGKAYQNGVNTLTVQGITAISAIHAEKNLSRKLSLYTGIVPGSNTNSAAYFQPSPQSDKSVRLISNKVSAYFESSLPALSAGDLSALSDTMKKWNMATTDQTRADAVMSAFGKQSCFIDQVSVGTSLLYDELSAASGIKQITLDHYKLGIEFLIELLQDESSLTSEIFENQESAMRFANDFSGIATGWQEGQSPFLYLKHDENGISKDVYYKGNGNYDGPCDRLGLLGKLQNKEIAPTSLLCFFIMMVEGGLLAIGGMFQSAYCTQLRDRAVPLLKERRDLRRAETLASMKTDVVALTPVWGVKGDGDLLKYGDLLKQLPFSENYLKAVPSVTGSAALYGALPCLYNLLGQDFDIESWQKGLSAYNLLQIEETVLS